MIKRTRAAHAPASNARASNARASCARTSYRATIAIAHAPSRMVMVVLVGVALELLQIVLEHMKYLDGKTGYGG